MRLFVFFPILFLTLNIAQAASIFIEPGMFMNMYDGAHVRFETDENKRAGSIRNSDLSYAIKIGLHTGRYEFGFETELYDYEAHFDSSEGGEVRNLHVTYNSLFLGYEFSEGQLVYCAFSFSSYMSVDDISYQEHRPILSFEYSNHLKEWVSLNVKLETESEFERPEGEDGEAVRIGTMVLVGFSFPLIQN